MDNFTANSSRSATEDVSAIIGTTTADGVLLLVVFIASVANLLIIAALIGKENSELVRSIRVILVNLLAACVLGALGAALYHISSSILRLSSPAAAHGPALCHTSTFLITTSSSGRILFTTFYGVAVFIVVHFWNRPVLAPRNTKYFIIASAVMWLLAVATGIPSLAEESVSRFCGISTSNITGDRENTSWSSRFILHVTLPYIIVPSFAVIVTPAMLIKTSCYIRRKGIGTQRDTKKALVKFGLFLMIVQGINVFSQVVVPLVALGISTLQMNLSLFYIIAIAVADLSLVPTSVLITVFFKPVRVRVQRWICCFRHEQAARSRPGT